MQLDLILQFLRKLRRNNNREWFERHKQQYLEAKKIFEDFLEAFHKELLQFDESLAALNPRKQAFRIYRDVRFSRDKRPFKENMGAAFSQNGKMEQEAGYYIHLEPGNCFVAGGLYMPDAVNLARVRQEIDYNGEILIGILNNKSFKKYFKALDEIDKLKTTPKGYPPNHPYIELLRNKSFVVSYAFSDEEVSRHGFVKKAARVCKAMKPFNDFLNTAIDAQ